MQKILSDHDRDRLNGLVAETEKRTKTQIVLALIRRSDSYPELPWKAFALGASIADLLVFLSELTSDNWYPRVTPLIAVAAILASGFVFALMTIVWPGFAKRFISENRSEAEVQQYAESLFLSRELFATSSRTGILMLISLFERKVIILPDKGLKKQLTGEAMQNIIAVMTPFLKKKAIHRAFEAGLARLSDILEDIVQSSRDNELPDAIIEEKGV